MKITIEVTDTNKADLLLEFLRSLSYANIIGPKTKEPLPDWHIAILQQRLEGMKKDKSNAIDFDKALNEIKAEL